MNVGFYTIPNRPQTHVDIGQKLAKKVPTTVTDLLIGKGVKNASSCVKLRAVLCPPARASCHPSGHDFPLFARRDIRRKAVKYLTGLRIKCTHCTPLECGRFGLSYAIDIAISAGSEERIRKIVHSQKVNLFFETC